MLCVTFTSSCGAGLASARGLCAAGETQGLCRSLAKRPRCGHGYWMDVCAGLILEGAVRLVCLYMWRWGLFALVPGRPAQGRGGADGAPCARGARGGLVGASAGTPLSGSGRVRYEAAAGACCPHGKGCQAQGSSSTVQAELQAGPALREMAPPGNSPSQSALANSPLR